MVDANFERKERRMLVMRNFVFGVEDSLVSTVGLLSGIAAVGIPQGTVILTGVVLVFVEAFSMAVGTSLAEHSAEEYAGFGHDGRIRRGSLLAGSIMFVSYFVSGFIPLAPYLVWEDGTALVVSVAASLAALFALGAVSARASHVPMGREAFRMLLIGGAAVGVGVLVGTLVH
ncbi:MAG: VIT1/CCC1 transporter family protein [Candidatus Jorgensenbacteria bacterium]|nr:VIT1/CCC1 transporter family protein [Candidatus Jorgensenbacteria bacterium]